MRHRWLAVLAVMVLASPSGAGARGHGSRSSSSSHAQRGGASHRSSAGTRHSATRSGSHGKRDPEQRARFMRSHPCPSTGRTHGACPGYVVDHVRALKHGGADDPSNMQWQSVEASKAKDRWE